MLLDINFSNTVFETYSIAPPGEELPELDRELDPEWEREGPVEGRDDYRFRVQAMAPGMTRVGFPRYIRTELRDFFFLTLRPEALGPLGDAPCSMERVDDAENAPARAWRCGLQLADQEEVELFQMDLRRARLSLADSDGADDAWLAWSVSTENIVADGPALVLRASRHGGMTATFLDRRPDEEEQGAIVLSGWDLASDASPLSDEETDVPGVVAALDSQGRLVLAGASWLRGREIWPRLEIAGFTRALFLREGPQVLAVEPETSPMAVRIFEETEPVPQRVWGPIHREAQRRIDEQGLTRHYVQIRHYVERDR